MNEPMRQELPAAVAEPPRPDIKHGGYTTEQEDRIICLLKLHRDTGAGASKLPGRTDSGAPAPPGATPGRLLVARRPRLAACAWCRRRLHPRSRLLHGR